MGFRRAASTRSTPTATPPWTPRCSTGLRRLKVISNFGVGVDHIDVKAATARGIPVGNTPGILDGATADLAFALLLAAGRRVVEGDRYARGPDFTALRPVVHARPRGPRQHARHLRHGPHRPAGREARRGFDMTVLYHNRNRNDEAEVALGARYATKDELLATADYVVLTVPLTPETRGLDRPGGTGEDEADRDARQRRPRGGGR